jgi:hypothetical protein
MLTQNEQYTYLQKAEWLLEHNYAEYQNSIFDLAKKIYEEEKKINGCKSF